MVNADVSTLANQADAVVVAVGFDSSSESEGADRTFHLPPGQDALIQAVLAKNKNTIVVITSGGAVDMNAWIDRVPALLQSWYPGQEGGTALAQLLFGEFSPSGKLPVSFERRFEDNAVYKSYYADPPESKKVKYTKASSSAIATSISLAPSPCSRSDMASPIPRSNTIIWPSHRNPEI